MDKDLKNSVDFITKTVGKKTGFSVPANYFDNLENSISTIVTEGSLPTQKPFDIPEDYFNKLEDNIFSKINSEENKLQQNEVKVISLYQRVLQIIPYTAAASVVLFLSVFFFNKYNTSISIDDITTANIENWYEESYGSTNTTELAMVFETTDFNEEDDFSISFSDDNLENYINNTNNNIVLNEEIE